GEWTQYEVGPNPLHLLCKARGKLLLVAVQLPIRETELIGDEAELLADLSRFRLPGGREFCSRLGGLERARTVGRESYMDLGALRCEEDQGSAAGDDFVVHVRCDDKHAPGVRDDELGRRAMRRAFELQQEAPG